MSRDSFLRCLAALARAHNYPLAKADVETFGRHTADLDPACVDEALERLAREAEPHLPFPSVNAVRKAAAQIAAERAEADGQAPAPIVDPCPVSASAAGIPRVGGTRR